MILSEIDPRVRKRLEEEGQRTSRSTFSERTLEGALLILWWDVGTPDALALALLGQEKGDRGWRFAEGAQLGKTKSDLGLKGGGEWVGKWELVRGRIRIEETFPRPRVGAVIEVDLSGGKSNGTWRATRTMGGISEAGTAELLFATPDRK